MAVTVFVNGVDLSALHSPDGFSIKNTGLGIVQSSCRLVDIAGTATINMEHVLRILDGATEIFEGPIRVRTRTAVRDPGIAKKVYDVDAQDFTAYLADDVIDANLVRTGSRTDKAEVEFLVTTYGTKGITVGSTVQNTGTISRDIDYSGMTLWEALEEAGKWMGTKFYVDTNLALHWFVTESNAAPFNLSDTPNNSTTFGYRNLKLDEDAADYANAVYVVGTDIAGWRPNPPPSGATRRGMVLRDASVTTQAQLDAAGDAALVKYGIRGPIKLRTFTPGLKAGMTVQLTNVLWGISAVTYNILEVITTYLPKTNSLQYDVTLNSKPVDLREMFNNTQQGIVTVGSGVPTVSELAIDLSVGGGNLVKNSSFEDGTSWVVGSNWVIGHNPGAGLAFNGTKEARAALAAQTAGSLITPKIPVVRTDDYWFSAWIWCRAFTSGGGLRFKVLEYNASNTLLATTIVATVAAAGTDWTRYSMRFGPNAQVGRTAFQPTTTQVAIAFDTSANNTATYSVDGVQLERGMLLTAYAPSPYELVDGSVGTTQIADDAVTSPKLIANAVVAGKIAADAVTSSTIAAGAVTAGKLQVGLLPARNLLGNGGFREGVTDWIFAAGGAPGAVSGLWTVTATDWTLADGDVDNWTPTGNRGSTGYMSGTNTASQFFPQLYQDVPVVGNEYYSFSGLFGVHRLNGAYCEVEWFTAAGGSLGTVTSAVVSSPSAGTGGPEVSGWNYLTIDGTQAPATARYARVKLVARTPNTSGTDWYLFLDQMWFGVGRAAQKYQPADAYGVRNSTGKVVIDPTGITIEDGALTLKDAYGSTVMTASGFAGTWSEFVAQGLYNGLFSVGSTGAITFGSTTQLPYWVASNVTFTGGSLDRSADASWPGGFRLRAKWTTQNSKAQIQSDDVPVIGGQIYRVSTMWGWNIAAATDSFALQMEIGWVDAAGGLISTSVIALAQKSGIGSATKQVLESWPATAPANAKKARVRVQWRDFSASAPNAANYMDVGSVGLYVTHPAQGTAFPTFGSNTDGDRFYRTDLAMEFEWNDATNRWLSITRYTLHSAVVLGHAGSVTDMRAIVPTLEGCDDIWMQKLEFGLFVAPGGSALSGSHKWDFSVQVQPDATTVATATINSGSSNVWRRIAAAAQINALMGGSNVQFETTITKTGTPGALYGGWSMTYRLAAS